MKKGIILLAALLITFCGCNKQQNKDHSLKESSVASSSAVSEEEISVSIESSTQSEESSKQESKQTSTSAEESEKSLDFVDFSGEAKDYTLENFYESPEAQVIIETAKNEYKSDIYDISVGIKDENTVEVTATIKDGTDPSLYDESMIEKYFNSAESQADMYIKMLETTTTTDDIKILARIQTSDGTEIGSRTFTKKKTIESENEESPLSLKDIVQSGVIQNALKNISDGLSDGSSGVTTSVEDNKLTVNIQLQQCVPDEGISIIKDQFESVSHNISAAERQLQALTGDPSVTVSVNVIDACGKIIASK